MKVNSKLKDVHINVWILNDEGNLTSEVPVSSPFIPCPLTYTDFPAGGSAAPLIIAGRDPSDTQDKLYPAGYLWLSNIEQGGTGSLFVQSGNSSGSANWSILSAGTSSLNTLSDGSTIVSPSGSSNIALEGTANQITSTGSAAAHSITFSIPGTFIAPGSIASTSTLTAGTDLVVTNDATIGNDLVVTNDATVGGNLTITGSIVLGGLSVDGTVDINTSGNGATTVGNAAGSGAILFDVGSGDFTITGNGNEIHIGDDAAANLITIGSQTGAAALTLQSGTGDVTITGSTAAAIIIGSTTQTGLITLGRSTAGQDIDIGSAINTVAQVIDIGNGASGAASTVRILSGTGTASTATLLMGNNPRLTVGSMCDVAPSASRTVTVGGGTVVTAAVTDTIDIGPDGATTNANSIKTVNVNTGGVTLGQVLTNIASGAVTSGTHTTSIASGNRAAGTMALNIMTGTGTKTATLGNADGGTTFNVLGITNINASQNSNTAINSGTSTGTVTIGNAAAGAITVDTAAGISLDAATLSNFTVTGAGADLQLGSAGGSVLVSSTEDAALAIRLHADGGVTETIQIHSDQGTGVASIGLLSDVGGITVRATGLASADAINLEAAAGGIDVDAALQINIASSQNAVDAIRIVASAGGIDIDAVGAATEDINITNTGGSVVVAATEAIADAITLSASSGGIDISSGGAGLDIDIVATGGSVNIQGTQAAADAITINASNAAGGIDISTGGGSIDISSAGFVTMVPATDTQASPSASSTLNVNVGAATFTGFTTASAASQVFTIVNSIITTSSKLFVTVCNEGANDAQMTVMRVKRIAGSMEVTCKNNGAAALNGNVTVNFWVIAA